MKLTPEQESLIKDIIDTKLKNYYCYQDPDTLECITLDEKKRSELGQFYTPADICIKMINMYKTETVAGKNVLDPCCGSGNLLIAMLCAGADTDKIYGNDFDADAVKICRGRIKQALKLLGRDESEFRDWQIHQGNALIEDCLTLFGEDYDDILLAELLAKRKSLHGGYMNNPEAWEEKKAKQKKYKDNAARLEKAAEENASYTSQALF